MSFRHRRPPVSYDEIVRDTVRGGGLAPQPTQDEERLSRHRFGECTEHLPHPLSPFERALREQICEALAADPALDLAEVIVDIDGHEVVLTGTVPGPATAIRIEDIAAEFPGVDSVDNQLVVRSSRR
jgi:hypothetical protein